MTLLPIALRLALLPILPIPVPAVHDEFSYLFAAKTFLLGRMANPTPPMWINLQPFHILSTPSYTSIFPVGMGLLLAAGQLVFGNYWFGVCFAVGGMCGTLTWMLYGWLPARWAVFGGLLAVLQFGIAHYWMNGYWGGALAGIGGSLVLGSIPRLKRHLRIGYSFLLAIGVALLANTRAFEGLVLTIAVFLSIVYWLARYRRYAWKDVVLRGVLPFTLVMLPVLMAMGLQFRAATGSAFVIPHELYRRQMAIMQTFVWQPNRPEPHYYHEVMRQFFVLWEPGYEDAKEWGTWRGLIPCIRERARVWGACYFPDRWYLPLALLSLLAAFTRRVRLLGFYILFAFAGTLLSYWLIPHYMAPILGAMLAVHVQFLRYVHAWRRWAFTAILVLLAVLFAYRYMQRIPPNPDYWANYRDQMQRELEHQPGKHLVYVRYSDHHVLQDEWVFNEPDIPSSKVIWARVMTPEQDRELSTYFHDRKLWVVEADANPPVLLRLAP
jgi:hypothetical protein